MRFKIEKERKFLVKVLPRSYLDGNSREETQWYICFDPPIRVRVESFDDCYLTIKIVKQPGEDYELEYSIPRRAIPVLEKVRKKKKIYKTRYFVGNLELDVFLAQLADLVLLEFEKKTGKEILEIPSDLAVEEVTGDERFRNHNLAKLDSIPDEWRCKIV